MKTCPKCGDTGYVDYARTCAKCGAELDVGAVSEPVVESFPEPTKEGGVASDIRTIKGILVYFAVLATLGLIGGIILAITLL